MVTFGASLISGTTIDYRVIWSDRCFRRISFSRDGEASHQAGAMIRGPEMGGAARRRIRRRCQPHCRSRQLSRWRHDSSDRNDDQVSKRPKNQLSGATLSAYRCKRRYPVLPPVCEGYFLTRSFTRYGCDPYAPDEKTRNISYVSPLPATTRNFGTDPAPVTTVESNPQRDNERAHIVRPPRWLPNWFALPPDRLARTPRPSCVKFDGCLHKRPESRHLID
jgi:hypothetical protein